MSKKIKQEPENDKNSESESESECIDSPRKKTRTLLNPAVKIKSKTDIEWLTNRLPNAWKATSEDYYNDPDVRLSDIYAQAQDAIPMSTFESSIFENRHFFMNRTVLIIGSAMLTLPLWAAKAHAKRVYVIDKSNAIEYLHAVVVANKYEHIIKLYKMDIEEVKLLHKYVDVIISNWMGFALLGDSKIRDVIYARDKWLNKKHGVIIPDKAELFLAGIQCPDKKREHVDWWRNVHDFSLQAMRALVLKSAIQTKIERREVVTRSYSILDMDLTKATLADLHIDWKGALKTKPNRTGTMDGLVLFFKVNFSKAHKRIGFTTFPGDPLTNWMQTVCYFNDPFQVHGKETFNCEFTMHSVEGFPLFENIRVNLKMHLEAPKNSEKSVGMTWILSQNPIPVNSTLMKVKNEASEEDAFVVVKTEITKDETYEGGACTVVKTEIDTGETNEGGACAVVKTEIDTDETSEGGACAVIKTEIATDEISEEGACIVVKTEIESE